METENDSPLSFERNLKEDQKKEAEMKRRLEVIRIETYKRITDNPKVLEFLQPYNSHFHDLFLQQYASSKSLWMEMKEFYKGQQEKNDLELQEIARQALTCLMKKKMLDLRREWGAGLIELPEITSPFDFMLQVDDVFTVDWIPPINQADLEILLAYVEQHNGYEFSFQFEYEVRNFTIPLHFEEGEHYGMEDSFSAYHSEKSGSGTLAILPDKKGLKVWEYIRLVQNKEKEEKEAKISRGELQPDKELDMKPFPPSDKSWFIEQFIREFDDKETLQNYLIYKQYHKEKFEEEEQDINETVSEKVETILHRLKHMDVVLPGKANTDWRLALIESWNEYRKKSISEAIVQVYEEYLFHVQTGIAWQTGEIKPATLKTVNDLKEKFLRGRELAGEPRDFEL